MRFVSALLCVLLLWGAPSVYAEPLDSKYCRKCQISEDGLNLIRNFEGYSPFIYKDAAGYPTIGFGHLIKKGEKFEEPLMGEAAQRLLQADVRPVENALNVMMTDRPIMQRRFDALGSFAFNVGINALRTSTLLRYVNAGMHAEVPAQFKRWINAGGVPLKGLKRRRTEEADMYMGAR